MENELLYAKVDHLEAGGFGSAEVDAMRWRPVDLRPSGVRRTTGLPRVGTGAVQRLRATVHATRSRASRRRGPVGAATDEVLVGHIRRVLAASPFHGEGYRKAWAKLRGERIRTSQERVRRLMREHGLHGPVPRGSRTRAEGT